MWSGLSWLFLQTWTEAKTREKCNASLVGPPTMVLAMGTVMIPAPFLQGWDCYWGYQRRGRIESWLAAMLHWPWCQQPAMLHWPLFQTTSSILPFVSTKAAEDILCRSNKDRVKAPKDMLKMCPTYVELHNSSCLEAFRLVMGLWLYPRETCTLHLYDSFRFS